MDPSPRSQGNADPGGGLTWNRQDDSNRSRSGSGSAFNGFSVDGDAGFLLPIDPALPASEQRVAIRCDENSCQPNGVTLPSGKLTLTYKQRYESGSPLGIFQFPANVDRPPPLHFAPFLSGKQLLTTQTFRDLFRSEGDPRRRGARRLRTSRFSSRPERLDRGSTIESETECFPR